MAKVSPFYSTLPGATVYHDQSDCTEGNNIEKRNLAKGTGGKDKCAHCKRLSINIKNKR